MAYLMEPYPDMGRLYTEQLIFDVGIDPIFARGLEYLGQYTFSGGVYGQNPLSGEIDYVEDDEGVVYVYRIRYTNATVYLELSNIQFLEDEDQLNGWTFDDFN